MPPSKWTCPRERMPATANTSYAVPQRRSRRRLAGSPKATNGVTPGPLHSRRRVVQGIQPPTLRHQRHPRTALPSPPRPQRCPKSSTKAPRPGHPAHGTSMRPIRVPKKQKYAQNCNFFAIANCREASKTRIDARKSGKSDAQRPFPPRGGRKGVRQSPKKVASEVGIFVSAKRIVATEQFLRKTRVPSMPIRPSSQHGTTAHRPYKHSCPHPWQRSRASSTEKCNI